MAFSIFGKSFGQKKSTTDYDKNSNEMTDLGFLVDKGFPFAEDQLIKNGEFYPFSFILNKNNTVEAVSQYSGDENPDSADLIQELKKIVKLESNKTPIKGIAIFYIVKTTDPKLKQETDAIAVFVEHLNDKNAYVFYYPYSLTAERELTFGKSFAGQSTKEVFVQ